ncbi:SGNH/GDSL hydrolase family protein [Adhaeribacter radiodurans]|uniref:SGNH/GDSL hydrolase family protein n=1 Tax=Adhaeribacter radiodurans TaxID=2745197 RepID=A0A7L7L430_9BACT|nr:SGNH/GDSL hydrolase family protein [Adhaeribacter radiodurans]QMU27556.1 SGNH/GDSL hydrolase family protein [Adhaeribacter radiodurans]
MNDNYNNRRHFLKQISTLGALAAAAPGFVQGMPLLETTLRKAGDNFTFLFQGDSITDGNRTRNNDWNHVMGHGYAYIIASKLWYEYPAKNFHFFNRGISGNKITDLASRWQTDALELKPDVLSILIGINDVSAFLGGNQNFTAKHYESGYRALLQQTKQQLPNVQLVLGEPFILPVGKVKEQWAEYSREVLKRREIVKKLSTEFQAVLVEFQNAFNQALTKAPAEYWIWDGIHPMPAGHELMAREWLTQVSKKLKFIKA